MQVWVGSCWGVWVSSCFWGLRVFSFFFLFPVLVFFCIPPICLGAPLRFLYNFSDYLLKKKKDFTMQVTAMIFKSYLERIIFLGSELQE
jgi:hypothetical protein